MKISLFFIFILSAVHPLPINSEALNSRSLLIENTFQKLNLLNHIVYYEDKNKSLNFLEIESLIRTQASQWSNIDEKEISFGFTKSAYWIYFNLKNVSSSNSSLYLESTLATMDRVDIFYRNSKGILENKTVGDMFPFVEREVKFRTLVFKIPLEQDEEKKIFLRIENKGPMKVSLYLRSAEDFSDYLSSDQVILGIYYGMMIVIAIYNLFLFFSIRDNAYIFYILYVINIALYQFFISGNAAQFLFPSSPDLTNRAPNVIANLSFFSALLFTKFFLNTREFAPRMNLVINFLMLGVSLFVFIILYVGHEMILMKTSNLFGLLFIVTIISTAVIVYLKGYRPARFFLLGWSFLLLAVLVQILANLGALNLTAENIGQIGSGIEVILLSFALGDRIKGIKKNAPVIETSFSKSFPEAQENQNFPSQRPLFVVLQNNYNLTYQQAQVCISLSDGKSRSNIAKELKISENTLKKHLSEIYSKTINRFDHEEMPSQEKLQKLTIFLHELKNQRQGIASIHNQV